MNKSVHSWFYIDGFVTFVLLTLVTPRFKNNQDVRSQRCRNKTTRILATRTTHLVSQTRNKIPASRHQTSNHESRLRPRSTTNKQNMIEKFDIYQDMCKHVQERSWRQSGNDDNDNDNDNSLLNINAAMKWIVVNVHTLYTKYNMFWYSTLCKETNHGSEMIAWEHTATLLL